MQITIIMSIVSLDEVKAENSRPEPIKVSWITDFKLICPDRDILVVKECLISSSKVFKVMLENEKSDFLNLNWNSSGVAEVMKAIHVFPGHTFELDLEIKRADKVEMNKDIVEFCFKYDIEPLLTTIKNSIIETIRTVGSNSRWIEFFHRWKNNDKTEPFEEQTRAMRLLAINNCKCIRSYFGERSSYHHDDVIEDYQFIIKGLVARLKKTEKYSGIEEENRLKVTFDEVEQIQDSKSGKFYY